MESYLTSFQIYESLYKLIKSVRSNPRICKLMGVCGNLGNTTTPLYKPKEITKKIETHVRMPPKCEMLPTTPFQYSKFAKIGSRGGNLYLRRQSARVSGYHADASPRSHIFSNPQRGLDRPRLFHRPLSTIKPELQGKKFKQTQVMPKRASMWVLNCGEIVNFAKKLVGSTCLTDFCNNI